MMKMTDLFQVAFNALDANEKRCWFSKLCGQHLSPSVKVIEVLLPPEPECQTSGGISICKGLSSV